MNAVFNILHSVLFQHSCRISAYMLSSIWFASIMINETTFDLSRTGCLNCLVWGTHWETETLGWLRHGGSAPIRQDLCHSSRPPLILPRCSFLCLLRCSFLHIHLACFAFSYSDPSLSMLYPLSLPPPPSPAHSVLIIDPRVICHIGCFFVLFFSLKGQMKSCGWLDVAWPEFRTLWMQRLIYANIILFKFAQCFGLDSWNVSFHI